ncbi:MAG: UDP-N-acetylmuramate dehydrogenase [Pseudomonadota bacterium]
MSADAPFPWMSGLRGRVMQDASLAEITWFRVGGPADALFIPADAEDLADFLKAAPESVEVYPLGVGSNVLVRDGGYRGVIVRLSRGFAAVEIEEGARIRAGAGVLDASLAKAAREAGIAGLEFYIGVPGSVGGALRMNAGAYGAETKDVLIEATGLRRDGSRLTLTNSEMGFSYRKSGAPLDVIFTEAVFQGRPGAPAEIGARMEEISRSRDETQPIRERTGGSTFKNPDASAAGGRKAWQLIDAVGGRGRVVGGAAVSEQHCNFLINKDGASAADLERLGESLRSDVKSAFGLDLDWEIRRIGEPAHG